MENRIKQIVTIAVMLGLAPLALASQKNSKPVVSIRDGIIYDGDTPRTATKQAVTVKQRVQRHQSVLVKQPVVVKQEQDNAQELLVQRALESEQRIREEQIIAERIRAAQQRNEENDRRFQAEVEQKINAAVDRGESMERIQEGLEHTYRNIRENQIYAAKKQETVTATKKESVKEQQKQRCNICMDDKDEQDFNVLACGHGYCKGCLTVLIDGAIREKNTAQLRCPTQGCYQQISEQDLKKITDNDRKKLDALAAITTQEYLAKQKNAKHCPTADCTYVFLKEDECAQSMKCPTCKKSYCSECLIDHDPKVSCKAAEAARGGDRAFREWKRFNTKPCPVCRVAIEKGIGCNTVECSQCRNRFCWNCLGLYDHKAHDCHPRKPEELNPPADHPDIEQLELVAAAELQRVKLAQRAAALQRQAANIQRNALIQARNQVVNGPLQYVADYGQMMAVNNGGGQQRQQQLQRQQDRRNAAQLRRQQLQAQRHIQVVIPQHQVIAANNAVANQAILLNHRFTTVVNRNGIYIL